MKFLKWVKKEIIWLDIMLAYYVSAIKIWSGVEVKKISPGLKKCSVVVVSVIDKQTSQVDIDFFFEYYRTLGFSDFILIIEKGSRVDVTDYSGVSIFVCDSDVKNPDVFRDLINIILYKYCVNKWSLMTGINEYMVYPYCDTRDVTELIDFLSSTKQKYISGISGICEDSTLVNSGYEYKYIKTYDRIGGGVKLGKRSADNNLEDFSHVFNRVAMIRWSKKYAFKKCYSSITPSYLSDGYKFSKILVYFLNKKDLDYLNITKDPVSIINCWPEIEEKGLIHDGEWS